MMKGLTLKSVSEAAFNNILPDQLTTVILGSEKLLNDDLKKLGDDFILMDAQGNHLNG